MSQQFRSRGPREAGNRHLHDVAGLEALEAIARGHDVDLIARGGLARRSFVLAARRPDVTSPDLFDLVPFASAIELTHTGGPELTTPLLRAIRLEVPLAECFRWELRSAAEASAARDDRVFQADVPIDAVTIGVRSGFEDPMSAREDVARKRYRYVRNARFGESPRARAARDLEVFGALRFLRAVCEDEAAADLDSDTFHEVRSTFEDEGGVSTIALLRGRPRLRARLHLLLKALAVEARTPAARALLDAALVRAFAAEVDRRVGGAQAFEADLTLDPVRAIVASEHLGEDAYRLPPLILFGSPDAQDSRSNILSPFAIARHEAFQGPGARVLRVSTWARVEVGEVETNRWDDGASNEMIHFAFLTDGERDDPRVPLEDEDVGVIMLFRRGLGASGFRIESPFASCVTRPYRRDDGTPTTVRSFRLACGSLFDRLSRSDEGGALHVAFIIAARSVEEGDWDDVGFETPTLRDSERFDDRLVGAR